MTWKQVGPNKGNWTEYENSETGERSIKEHTLKVVKQWCAKDKHVYRVSDMKKRIAVCNVCDHETTFIVGKDIVDGNKVIIN